MQHFLMLQLSFGNGGNLKICASSILTEANTCLHMYCNQAKLIVLVHDISILFTGNALLS